MRRAYTELFCHLVWATWDRLPLICEEVEPRLHGAIQAKVREFGCKPIALGGSSDHVHCLCQFPATITIAELVGGIKGASSHLMTHEVVGRDEFKWQGGYGAFTVGTDGIEAVRQYIGSQKTRHERQDLWPDWERTWLPD